MSTAKFVIILASSLLCHQASSQTWQELFDSAKVLSQAHQYDSAVAVGEQALTLARADVSAEDTVAARILHTIGGFHHRAARYSEAEQFYQQALEASELLLGPDHLHVANTLNNLAVLYRQQSKYNEAEQLTKRACVIFERVYGSDHPQLARSKLNLAAVYRGQGKFDQAEELYKQGLAALEESVGPESGELGIALNNLANLYSITNRPHEAEPLLRRAVKIWERVLGPDHPDLATAINNLATINLNLDKYSEAESLCRRALEIAERVLGPSHPLVSDCLQNLAKFYMGQGDLARAESLYERALSIRKKSLTPAHPEVTKLLMCLGITHTVRGEYGASLDYYREFLKSRLQFTERMFAYSSEAQKLRWVSHYPLLSHSILSLALADTSWESRALALEMVLKGKAVTIDAVMAEKKAAYCSYDDKVVRAVELRSELCTAIANLTLTDVSKVSLEIYRDSLGSLTSRLDSVETELSRLCSEFKDDLASRRFSIEDISKALPPDVILIEIVQYEPFAHQLADYLWERTGSPRYLAFVLSHDSHISIFDLGRVDVIDSLVNLTRDMLYRSGTKVYSAQAVVSERRLASVTSDLYAKLLAPLSSHLEGRRTIYLSPDGLLNLLPFEIMVQPDDSYLVENYRICYLSSGRDLLKFGHDTSRLEDVVLMVDPDYDLSATIIESVWTKEHILGGVVQHTVPRLVDLECIGNDFSRLRFGITEAQAVAEQFTLAGSQNVVIFSGTDASEENLKRHISPPRLLHLATHGFFCESRISKITSTYDNPLLRCGLALAGANRTAQANPADTATAEDGILTALEVSSLNFIGTELITLSACESGLGRVTNGEGIFGLRRAFQHAGARSILTSLWRVPDKASKELMTGFYTRWLSGSTKSDALRESCLELLTKSRNELGHGHPLMWGGFVLTGNPF